MGALEEPVLIVSGRDMRGTCAVLDFELDMEFGDGSKNDFEAEFESPVLSGGEYLSIDGTEFGGIVDKFTESSDDATVKYVGRTWHGILEHKIICPDSGQDYYTVSGDANDCLRTIVSRVDLGSVFSVVPQASGIYVSNYRFERYTDAYTGIRKMLAKSGAKLMMSAQQGSVSMWAEQVGSVDGTVDSDVVQFDATTISNQVNHLIGLGKGELKDRAIAHWYSDSSGNVSQTQTLFGVDEYAAIYDYGNDEADKISDDTMKKLKDVITTGEIKFSDNDIQAAYVGDVITARNNRTGRTVTAPIAKKVVKVSGGVLTVQYDVGEQSTTSTSLSGSGETASSGTVYTAGDGIKITSGKISAEVTQAELDAVAETAQQGVDDASSASAAAGAAQSKADSTSRDLASYESSNDSALAAVKATADAAVSVVTAASPIAATRSGNSVSLSHAASGVAAGAYGPTADATPTWGESVTVGARLSVDKDGHVTSAVGRSVRLPSSTATASAAGLMAAADKAKLDGIAAGAQANAVSSVNGKVGAVSLGASDVGALPSSGNAASASRLSTPRTISISGAVTGSAEFDGSGDVTIVTTGQSAAAQFLAAYPVGSYYLTSDASFDPSAYGGTWELVYSIGGPITWHRTA